MDSNVAAAIITALVALVAVLGTAVFATIRRNGNGAQQRGSEIIDLFRISNDSLRDLSGNQAQIVATQSEIIRGQERIVAQIGKLVDTHVKMEGSLQYLDALVEERRREASA